MQTFDLILFSDGEKSLNEKKFNTNKIRLCFQVFIEIPKHNSTGKCSYKPLPPVVSNVITDKNGMKQTSSSPANNCGKLMICKISNPSSSVAGDENIIILCEHVCTMIKMDAFLVIQKISSFRCTGFGW